MRKAAFLMTVLLWGIAAQGLEPSRSTMPISRLHPDLVLPMRYGGRAPASPGGNSRRLHRLPVQAIRPFASQTAPVLAEVRSCRSPPTPTPSDSQRRTPLTLNFGRDLIVGTRAADDSGTQLTAA